MSLKKCIINCHSIFLICFFCPQARKIEEHKRKKERRAIEKAEKERLAALKKAREEAKAREDNTRPSQTEGSAPGGPGGMPGMPDFYQYLNDPEVLQAFQVDSRFIFV